MSKIDFETLYEAFFSYKAAKSSKPLFKNQLSLAEELKNLEGGGFEDKNILTIRSTLNQALTGERILGSRLKNALLKIVESKFDKKKYDFADFEEKLIEKFKIVFDERLQYKKDRTPDRDFDTLIEKSKTATHFLISTMEPAELKDSELADRLKNELLEKTGIVSSEDEYLVQASYKFFFPNDDRAGTARQFWEALKKHAMNEYNLSVEEANKRIGDANRSGRLKTYLAPVKIAMHPYVFLNYLDETSITGFTVSYRNSSIPSVGELSLTFVYKWLTVYWPEIELLLKDAETPESKINFPFHTNI